MDEESKEAKQTLRIGTMLDSGEARYRILDVLGQGGFGITYLVTCQLIVNNVPTYGTFAIKEHFPTSFSDRQESMVIPKTDKQEEYDRSLRDFISEAKKLHTLGTRNDNIVKVNEVFETNGTAYYVMQYIHGKSLSSYVTAKGKLPYNEAVTLLAPIIDAVGFLHSSRINHLDIKPDNIMLNEREKNVFEPVLIDFGLSVHFKKNGDRTSPKGVLGISEGYSPIEQYAGVKEFNPATDIYALAATLLYMLTGVVPRGASEIKLADIKATLTELNTKTPKDQAKIPDHAITAICNAMRKSDEDRTQSVGQFKSELQINIPTDDTVPIINDDTNAGSGISRNTLYIIIIAISLILLIVGFIFLKPKKAKRTVVTETVETVEPAERTNRLVAETESPSEQPFLERLSLIALGGVPDMKEIETLIAEQKVQDEKAKRDEKKKRTETSSSSSRRDDYGYSDYQEPETPRTTNGTLSLGYGSWKGGIKNGKPDGRGTLTFSSSHSIGGYTADPGDYFVGQYYDGYPSNGKLYDSSGTLKKTIIL